MTVFEIRMFSKTFLGFNKRLEETDEDLHSFHTTLNIIKLMRSRSMKLLELVLLLRETINAHKDIMRKTGLQRQFRRPRRR
jgi:hypothetical protein